MEKSRKMKLGRDIVDHKTMKQTHKIIPLLSPIVLLLTSKIGQNLEKNVFKSSKTYFFQENVLGNY